MAVFRQSGVKLCMEGQGEAARNFQYPYQAWTYEFEGKLIAAPNLTKMPDIDRDEYGQAKVHIREYLGYIWVCLADGPPSFEEDVMGAIEERLGRVHAIDGDDVANLGSASVLGIIDGSEGLDLIPSVSAESGKDVTASAELPCKPTRL